MANDTWDQPEPDWVDVIVPLPYDPAEGNSMDGRRIMVAWEWVYASDQYL